MVIEKIKNNSLPKSLVDNIINCRKCNLSKIRKRNCKPVVGRGSIPADILFIGEAPGRSEEVFGVPFVGQAGKFFDTMLHDTLQLIKKEYISEFKFTYYITNSVLCRPSDFTSGENREPKSLEVLSCMNHIINIASYAQPKLVIFLGKIAEKFYKREFKDYTMIYHPAYFIRGGGKFHPHYLSQIRKLSEALCRLKK
jgi:DNA polymerase